MKSASIEELIETKEWLSKEIEKRQAKPHKMNHVVTFTDGAARGNPGPAGIGVLILDEMGEKILQDYQYLRNIPLFHE